MALTGRLPQSAGAGASTRKPLLAYFGHHKCASTWLNDIAREMCAAAGMSYAHVHSPHMFEEDLGSFVSGKRVDFLTYANANRRYVSALDNFRGFHVIRDPRDIVVSSYFSHLHSHPTTDWPELVDHRRRLQAVDKDQGLYVVIDFLAGVFDDIATWDYSDPRVLELKMEDLVLMPEELLIKAFGFIGLVDEARTGLTGGMAAALSSVKRRRSALVPFRLVPLPATVVIDTLRRNAFARKSDGRAPGVERVDSHYRKGVAGDWLNHFGPGHRAYFKDRYGDLLVRLGYADGTGW
jgi:hypothetical protein